MADAIDSACEPSEEEECTAAPPGMKDLVHNQVVDYKLSEDECQEIALDWVSYKEANNLGDDPD